MPNRIKPRRSYTANSVPLTTDLETNELAINWADSKAFTKDAAGNIVSVTLGGGGGGSGSIVTAASVSAFPASGSASNLYITSEDQRIWRWDATASIYVESGPIGGSGLTWSSVPATPTATGSAGSIAYDDANGFFYVASATNTWRRFRPDGWDANRSSVSLLVPFDGNLTDYSPAPKTLTSYNNANAFGASRAGFGYSLSLGANYGGSFAYENYDGTGDHVEVSHATAFNFGSGDFTVECWYYPIARGPYSCVWGSADYPMTLYHGTDINSGSPAIYFGTTSSWFSASISLGSVSNNAWCHIAIVRQGDTFRAYKNGVQQGTSAPDSAGQALGDIPTLYLGRNSQFYNKCLIDDFRVTKGVCRYPSGTTFTPPTTALPID
jgi:hypothetical protein